MEGRKLDLKELALEAFYTVKNLLEQFVEDFQQRDRYFKYKAGIIAAWVVVSCATLGISCGGGPRENSLHAHITLAKVLDDQSLELRNDSDGEWKEVRLTLNGKYTSYTPSLPAGRNVVLTVTQFVGPEGQVPPKDLTPRTLRVACSAGTETLDLTRPPETP